MFHIILYSNPDVLANPLLKYQYPEDQSMWQAVLTLVQHTSHRDAQVLMEVFPKSLFLGRENHATPEGKVKTQTQMVPCICVPMKRSVELIISISRSCCED